MIAQIPVGPRSDVKDSSRWIIEDRFEIGFGKIAQRVVIMSLSVP